nr:unnamed protein product [Meloidogyne enterolobii]
MAVRWANPTTYNNVEDFDIIMLDLDDTTIWRRLRWYPVVQNDPSPLAQGTRKMVAIYQCRTRNCSAYAKVVKTTRIRNEAFVSAIVSFSVAGHRGHLQRSASEENNFLHGIQIG